MNYFVFRNATVELLFANLDAQFSGYSDVSELPLRDRYIWAYVPLIQDSQQQTAESILHDAEMLRMVLDRIPSSSQVFALTMCDLYSISYTSENSVGSAIEQYNTKLKDLCKAYPNLKVFDISEFFSAYERTKWVDWRYYFLSQIPINPKLNRDFGTWFQSQVNAVEWKRKKCLVLDLDHTLWGGIIGEDGIDGIQLGGSYPGNAFLFFQRQLLELSKHGIILCVCSKNNESDIKALWEQHPDICIKEQNLAAFRINWESKAENIKSMAQELNIGTDSMVFLDDNPTERSLVKGMLPEVETPDIPTYPYELPLFIKHIAETYFKVYQLSDEDRNKTEQYHQNKIRQTHEQRFERFEDYIKDLEISLSIQKCNPSTIARVAQMTQKTNQFNLTTKRYTDGDIRRLLEAAYEIYTLSVSDRFGDYGITGLCMVEINQDRANIDTFLMSCRVLGKRIEHEFLNQILQRLFNKGIQKVCAQYEPTAKNGQVVNFYPGCGFSRLTDQSFELVRKDFTYTETDLFKIQI